MGSTDLLLLEILLLFFIFSPVIFAIVFSIYVTIKWNKNKYNKCKRCEHYCDNGICQLKKCSTNNPYVNIFDKWFCSYFKKRS